MRQLLLLFCVLLGCEFVLVTADPWTAAVISNPAEETKPLHPIIISRGREVFAEEGDDVQLHCAVQNLGPYQRMWSNGKEILWIGEVRITQKENILCVSMCLHGFASATACFSPQKRHSAYLPLLTFEP